MNLTQIKAMRGHQEGTYPWLEEDEEDDLQLLDPIEAVEKQECLEELSDD